MTAKGPIFERSLSIPVLEGARMTPYSYRGLATDPGSGAFLLSMLDNSAKERVLWFYGTLAKGFLRSGVLPFPDRGCYPYLTLHSGRAAVLAVQDIIEPNEDWKKLKFSATGINWDYVFRRLYLTTCGDIRKDDFNKWLDARRVVK